GTNHSGGKNSRILAVSSVDLGSLRLFEPVMFRIADHANDRSERAVLEFDLLAERILVGPVPLRHELIDDHNGRRIELILVTKSAPFEKRDADSLEVIRHRGVVHHFGFLAFGWGFSIWQRDCSRAAVAAERQTTHQRS